MAQARDYELCVIHTSTPSFSSDAKVARALKDANPSLKVGFVGAKVAVQPRESLEQGGAIDFVARNEFDFTIKEVAEGRDWSAIDGISFRAPDGTLVHNRDRAVLEDMDQLPFVTEVYQRDLRIETISSATCSTLTSRSTRAAAARATAPSACGRRRSAGTAIARAASAARHRGDQVREALRSRQVQGILLRR